MAKTEKRERKPSFVSPRGPAVYPWLNQPDNKFKDQGQYKTGLRLTEKQLNMPLGYELGEDGKPDPKKPKSSLKELFEEAMVEAEELGKAEVSAGIAKLKEKFKKNPKAGEKAISELKAAFKSADLPYKDDPENEGQYIVNFKMNASYKDKTSGKVKELKPALVDAKKKTLNPKLKIGGGSQIRVSFQIIPFFTEAVGYGISLRMGGVQVLELVEFSGNSAESLGFEEEDGFESSEDSGDDSDDTDVAADSNADSDDSDSDSSGGDDNTDQTGGDAF